MSGAYGFPARECLCFARRLPRAEEVLEGARPSPPGPSKQARSTSISARILPSELKCVISVPEYPEFSWNYMELCGIIRPKMFETKDRCV